MSVLTAAALGLVVAVVMIGLAVQFRAWTGDDDERLARHAVSRDWDLVAAAVGLIAFVVAVVTGGGIKSLAFLGAAIWWLLFGRYWAKKSRAAQRHRELRRRRLERERNGLAPPPG
jgi:tetrahydromethanopterin S-methyltransferase subunit C